MVLNEILENLIDFIQKDIQNLAIDDFQKTLIYFISAILQEFDCVSLNEDKISLYLNKYFYLVEFQDDLELFNLVF